MPDIDTVSPRPEVVASFDVLRDDCGVYALTGIRLFELSGEDRKGWLQGQVTNDLRSFTPGTASAFCLCEATGQLQAVCDVWALSDRFVIATAEATSSALERRVEMMVILEDVALRSLNESYRAVTIQGPRASQALSEHLELPKLDAGEAEIDGAKVVCLRSNRTGLGGWDVLVPADRPEILEKLTSGLATLDPEAVEIARLEAGIPVHERDFNAKTLPPELGPAFEARHISYTKGCYMGQEVLMRIHSRGHTNRTWMGLLTEAPVEPGWKIRHPRRPDAGVVTSAAVSPDYGPIAAAMLRNEAAFEGEIVTVETPGGPVEAEVRQMPILRFD